MARPRGGALTEQSSTPIAVRLPNDLLALARRAAGGKAEFPEWLRNLVRRGCSIPLDFKAGYREGFTAGWADSKTKFQEGTKAAR
jgi:hypothetical protein